MTRLWTRPMWIAALAVAMAATTLAHHGWTSYDEKKPIAVDGTITSVQYANPHGLMKLDVKGKVWDVVLAPVSRMRTRGLTEAMLKAGTVAHVVGYQHREVATEMRAENVTINGKKIELR